MRKMELLAPGGDVHSIKAAIAAGADAVYCGLNRFNARNRAANISFDELLGVIRLAHAHDCQVFLTLNILILETEIPALIRLLNQLNNTHIDGVIVQDLGLLYILSNYFKSLAIHGSTQLTTHNQGQIAFLKQLGVERVNLSRELNLEEISDLSTFANQFAVQTEVFVHGSYCISFSGICYMSSVQSGKSGNRGSCSQSCREQYLTTPEGKDYPLNLKDNSAWHDLKELCDAGVSSLKIEGRIKEQEYVYTVVKAWKEQMRLFVEEDRLSKDNSALYKVFNRDFFNGFLKGKMGKEAFIDNPMSYSSLHHDESPTGREGLYAEKAYRRQEIQDQVKLLNLEKIPMSISFVGSAGTPLQVRVNAPGRSFELISKTLLQSQGQECLNYKALWQRFHVVNDTEYVVSQLNLEGLGRDLYFSFRELTSLKKALLFRLNGSKEWITPFELPKIKKNSNESVEPELMVLIASKDELDLQNKIAASICYQLPNSFPNGNQEFMELFRKNKKLIPWFPAILIGNDFEKAVDLLQQCNSRYIISNNSGIGYEAFKAGIPWIAGPQMNLTNSYSLLALQEKFNCTGAFVSDELNQFQLKTIQAPKDFMLFYNLFHPQILMTSRQCLFLQINGCSKEVMDENCLKTCEKIASLKDFKNRSYRIKKTKQNHNQLLDEFNFFNPRIQSDLPEKFHKFLIDLSGNQSELTNASYLKGL